MRGSNRLGCVFGAAAAALLCTAMADHALADGRDLAKADQLFREGKQLVADEDFAKACPLLAGSYRLDPATGTLLALAFCHERQGKLGTALREYHQVIARCKDEARPDRELAARQRALALEPRLSTLTIKTSNVSGLDDLEVRVNGARLDRAGLDRALAVDGGAQRIAASAKGKKPWSTEIRVAKSIDAKTIEIPPLEDDPSTKPKLVANEPKPTAVTPTIASLPPPARPPASPHSPSSRPRDEAHGLSPTQWVGLGAIGAGAIGLAAGTLFATKAISANRDSSKGCIGDVCTAEARQARLDARSAGNAATVSFIAGGALAVVGVSMYLLGQRSERPQPGARALLITPWVVPHELGGSIQGRF